jgi:SagB-type dehydrogenase family enzyme
MAMITVARTLVAASVAGYLLFPGPVHGQETRPDSNRIELPAPTLDGKTSVEQALGNRRSRRSPGAGALTLTEISQLLWAAQGVTGDGRLRTAPSAGALYPLELYLVSGGVDGLEAAAYRYVPAEHALELSVPGDLRARLQAAALGQSWVGEAPAALVIAGVVARTAAKYGRRAERYVLIEVGAAVQNVYLQCESLELSTVMVGAFRDADVDAVLQLSEGEAAYAILPLARRSGHVRAP